MGSNPGASKGVFSLDISVNVSLYDHLLVALVHSISVICVRYVLARVFMWPMYPKFE